MPVKTGFEPVSRAPFEAFTPLKRLTRDIRDTIRDGL